LNTCDKRLKSLFHEVVKHWDCTIVEGFRNEQGQDKAVREGASKVSWPDGRHNRLPSLAVDVAPYTKGKGADWNSRTCLAFGGFVLGIASQMHYEVRWGGDWDGDRDVNDQKFHDLVHFEVKEEKEV